MTSPGDTPSNPVPAATAPLEPKVKWGALASYIVGVIILAIVSAITANGNALLIDVLPDYLEAFILPMVPAVVSLGVGYAAKHQWRSDGGQVG